MEVSVAIPTYNHANYLGKAIDSVLAQTKPAMEVIVVDDGSTDGTAALAGTYGDRIRYVYQKNRGLSAARNRGTAEARGKWIAFLDSDDWWEPQKLAKQQAALEANPEAVLCYTGVSVHRPDGSVDLVTPTPPERIMPLLRLQNCVTGSGSAVCIRRDVLTSIGGFNENLTAYEDWDAWIRLAIRHPFAVAPEPLTCLRVTPASMSSTLDRMLRNMEIVVNSSLLEGLSGWEREVYRRRALSRELFRMAVIARDSQSPRLAAMLWASIRTWPWPGEVSRRYRFAVLEGLAGVRRLVRGSRG